MSARSIIDLSIPVDHDTPVYPGDPKPRTCQALSIVEDGFNVTRLELSSHAGTHCDAPYHFQEDGARIDELDLSLFFGPGVVIDVTHIGGREAIAASDIVPHRSALRSGVIVLLKTGWSRFRGTERYFAHPYLGPDACRMLLDAGVRTIGIDAINIDPTPTEAVEREAFQCHCLISSAGGVIVENLTNLDAISFPAPTLALFPLRLAAADGGPTRAVAIDLGETGRVAASTPDLARP